MTVLDRESAGCAGMRLTIDTDISAPDSRRRGVTLALFAIVIAAPLAASAQGQRSTARIGLLIAETVDGQASRIGSLRAGLADLGYVEGTNIAFATRTADGHYERLPALAAAPAVLEAMLARKMIGKPVVQPQR